MQTVFFVRHSIRDLSYQIDETAPLTRLGHQRAQELVPFFNSYSLTAIFSSPYLRTLSTIQPLAAARQLPIQKVPAFIERRVGTWVDDFPRFAHHQWQDFDYALPEGESLHDVKHRIVPAFQDLLAKTPGNFLICGHGTALSVLFHHLTEGAFGYPEFQEMPMPAIYQGSFSAQQKLLSLTECPLLDNKHSITPERK